MRRILVALVVMLAAAPIAGSVRAQDDAPSGGRRELAIGITQFPANFHPNFDAMLARSYVLGMTRRPFTAYGPDWQLTCMLCTELPTFENGGAVTEKQDDGSEGIAVTYTIRPEATWGDGVPVTTEDVLLTYEIGRHPQSGVTSTEMYDRITAIDVLDAKTFTMHVDRVTFEYNAINDFRLVPAHLDRAIFEQDPASYRNRTSFDTDTTNPGLYFGPYTITEVSSGAYVVLERNPTWWGAPPAFDRIVVKTIENTAALEANLLSGGIDMIAGEAGISLDQALAFEQRHGDRFQVVYKPGLFYEHIDLNLDNPILADLRVRRALIQGLDREALSQQLFAGRQPVAHTKVNELDWAYTDDVRHYEEDLDAAAALLDEAGWTELRDGIRHNAAGEPLRLELVSTAGNRTRELVQQVLQSQWRRLGIEIVIRNQPPRVLFGDTLDRRRFTGMAQFAWISAPEHVPRTILHSEEIPSEQNAWSGQNYTGFTNDEMDRLIDAVERELDKEKRRELWRRIQQIYAEELPALPLYFNADAHIWPHWLENVVPTGHLNPSSLWVETWRVRDG